MTDVCLSGGAAGSDMAWGEAAAQARHAVVHFSFAGHDTALKHTAVPLTEEQLLRSDPALSRANETLLRHFPSSSEYTNNLLRRNWYQVRKADSLYAVSTFDLAWRVDGGTGWAVQMFLDRFEGGPCEAYVFDQGDNGWFTYAGDSRWIPVTRPPRPQGVYAGIGTRNLMRSGHRAIWGVYAQ